MSGDHLSDLRQQHAFDTWRGSNGLGENLFIWRFFLSGAEFPSWAAHRIQEKVGDGQVRSMTSMWTRTEGKADELLNVDVVEWSSRVAAHEGLLRFLGMFQSPLVARQKDGAIGDVAFVGPEDTALLFARANLTVLMRNAGSQVVPVAEVARRFDADLIQKPTTTHEVAPRFERFEVGAGPAHVGRYVPLEVAASDPLGRPVWYKFFAGTGEVSVVDERLVYSPAAAGAQRITAFVLNANGGAATQELTFVAD